MLEGLEVSILNFKDIIINNEIFRYDSEYFCKEPMLLLNKIRSSKFFYIGDEFEVSKLAGFEYTKFFTATNLKSNDNYITLTSKNIQNEKLMLDDYITIDRKIADFNLIRSKLYSKDVVLSYTGEYRRALTLLGDDYQLGPNICRIRSKDKNNHSFYLSTFLNSKIGQIILDREKTLSAQPTVAMSRIRKIPVPKFSNDFYSSISNLIISSKEKIKTSKTLYKEAEEILLEEVGLKDFEPSQEKVSIKSFKDSFGQSGRLDAEYYQLKYEEVINKITSQNHNKLSEVVDIKKSIEPGTIAYSEDRGLPFMRVSDFSKNGITETNKYLNDSFVKENREKLENLKPKKDTILFSKDGTVGIAYKLREDYNGITSGAILHLNIKVKNVLAEYLTLVLNSELVQKQAERDAGGSIIQHWREKEIKNVIIPIIEKSKQEQIAQKIEKSFTLKKESERLLELAKKAVEIAIEKGEDEAMRVINNKTRMIDKSN